MSFEPPPPAQQTKTKPWAIVLAIVGSLFALLVLTIGFGAFYAFTGKETEPSVAERTLLIDVAAVTVGSEFEVDPRRETLLKTTYFDDSYELTYNYEDPRDAAPFVDCTVTFERSKGDALATYTALWASARIGMAAYGAGEIEVDESVKPYAWGDASRFAVLRNNGAPVGNVFLARKDKRLYFLIVAGWYYPDAEALGELIRPYLDRLDRHPN